MDADNSPSQGLNKLRRLIPHLYGQRVFSGKPNGRGVYVVVPVAAAGTDITVTHNLGRIPQIMPELVDSGTTYTPGMKRGTAAWTITTITLKFNLAGTFTLWVR